MNYGRLKAVTYWKSWGYNFLNFLRHHASRSSKCMFLTKSKNYNPLQGLLSSHTTFLLAIEILVLVFLDSQSDATSCYSCMISYSTWSRLSLDWTKIRFRRFSVTLYDSCTLRFRIVWISRTVIAGSRTSLYLLKQVPFVVKHSIAPKYHIADFKAWSLSMVKSNVGTLYSRLSIAVSVLFSVAMLITARQFSAGALATAAIRHAAAF